jgi:hypothetical protein
MERNGRPKYIERTPCSQIVAFDFVKMVIVPQIYRLKVIPFKIPDAIFVGINKQNIKII